LPMRRWLARALRGAGHTVHEAADGGAGIALARDVRPELVITDIVMPDMEGIETIRELRRGNRASRSWRSPAATRYICASRPDLAPPRHCENRSPSPICSPP
jgi:CheY-like chemotaxis protein